MKVKNDAIIKAKILLNPKKRYFSSPPLYEIQVYPDRLILKNKSAPISIPQSNVLELFVEQGRAVLVFNSDKRIKFGVASKISTGQVDVQETCQLVATINKVLELRTIKFNNLLNYETFFRLRNRKIRAWFIPAFILGIIGSTIIYFDYTEYSIVWTVFYFLLIVWICTDEGSSALKSGLWLYERGKYIKAIDYLKRSLRFYPECPEIFSIMAAAYQCTENLPFERYYLNKLILLNPSFLERSAAVARVDELTQAINDFRENEAISTMTEKYMAIGQLEEKVEPGTKVFYLPTYFDLIFYLYENVYEEYSFKPADEMTVKEISSRKTQNQVTVNETDFVFSSMNLYPLESINSDDVRTIREIFELKRIEMELEENERV